MSDTHELHQIIEALRWQKSDLRNAIRYGIGMLNGIRRTAMPDVQKELDAVVLHFNQKLEEFSNENQKEVEA